jgi:hypothetical protein
MGVLNCNRHGCNNVMCDRVSPIHGYICYECFVELVESGPETNIRAFMESDKKSPVNLEAANARFNVEFPQRDN